MKCRSVACIWPETPPAHRVTAAAALNHPPTLYTGGSDGSIIWWNLSFSDLGSNAEIKAVAMLCGHAASIADLAICYPMGNSGDEKIDDSSDDVAGSGGYGALFSACTDGVLCVWSRGSGHCRRRRKLPPWVGSPSVVRALPVSPRYVCIGCCFVEHAVHLSDHHADQCVEGGVEGTMDKESQQGRPSKCTIVVVDSYSLAIVQTVFHGNLSIGPLKFMDVVFSGENGERHSVLMADSIGRVQLVPILKDSNPDIEGGSALHKSSKLEAAICGSDLGGVSSVMFIATCGNLIVHVLKDRCIFRLLTSDSTIGEISLLDNCTLSHVLGGFFLGNGDTTHMQNCLDSSENICENFVVWSSTGFAIMYHISYLNSIFRYETLCEIPASRPFDMKRLVSFIQLKNYVLRIESVCFHVEEPLQWKSNITIWSSCQKHLNHKQPPHECKMLGKIDSFADWVSSSTLPCKPDDPIDRKMEITFSQISAPSAEKEHNNHKNVRKYSFLHNGRTISSSMVISESLFVPYAVVYGFFSGEIEVVYLDVFLGPDSEGGSPHCGGDSHASRQHLLGHTGAVLCLASHRMIGRSKGWSFSHVLVSGSMDCTVCIWDLDTGNLITVMHQHVAPVRQIILPPVQTECPWSDCFLSVGEDSCVALASLETLRVERMFPGHPSYPGKVVWDGVRGYIACLCLSSSGRSNVFDVLYIWDVKTGARERVLRGTASHSMLDHFYKGISVNSISGSISNANTSVSALLLPIIDDGSFSQSELSYVEKGANSSNMQSGMTKVLQLPISPTCIKNKIFENQSSSILSFLQANKDSIRCSCPFPGIASISFDLASLMFTYQKSGSVTNDRGKQRNTSAKVPETSTPSPCHVALDDGLDSNGVAAVKLEEHEWIKSLEEYLLRFSLSFLHLWNIDSELDKLLITDMKLKKPVNFIVASGLQGDKGSLTLTFPGSSAILELWKSSSEFCALRSLTVVSIAQRMISLSHSSSSAGR
uniref:Uncharacterized protein n=1 Tax=Rhizophora mucronata TaxID=61149 RepID=A0A2P2LLE4_RHIMU